jgi:hypothetical protein
MLFELFSSDSDRSRQLTVRLPPSLRVSRINKRELLTPIQPLFYFIDRDSCCFHASPRFQLSVSGEIRAPPGLSISEYFSLLSVLNRNIDISAPN